MIHKIPTIQYSCPRCGKLFSVYTKSQVWFQCSIHLEKCILNINEKEEMLKKCQLALGISEDELKSVETPRRQTIKCLKCGYEWKGKNPFHRKHSHIECPTCKATVSLIKAQKQLLKNH